MPDFLAQISRVELERGGHIGREWIKARHQEATDEVGCTWFRVSWNDDPGLVLFEGWRDRPVDEGEPQFQVTAVR